MQKVQKGFTLIELIVVIVLLGILGVTAMGRFQNLSASAGAAAASGIAAEITSASAVNYAASVLGSNAVTIDAGTTAGLDVIVGNTTTGCSTTELGYLLEAGWPTGVSVPSASTGSSVSCAIDGAGSTYSCTIDHDDGGSATATIVCTGG